MIWPFSLFTKPKTSKVKCDCGGCLMRCAREGLGAAKPYPTHPTVLPQANSQRLTILHEQQAKSYPGHPSLLKPNTTYLVTPDDLAQLKERLSLLPTRKITINTVNAAELMSDAYASYPEGLLLRHLMKGDVLNEANARYVLGLRKLKSPMRAISRVRCALRRSGIYLPSLRGSALSIRLTARQIAALNDLVKHG